MATFGESSLARRKFSDLSPIRPRHPKEVLLKHLGSDPKEDVMDTMGTYSSYTSAVKHIFCCGSGAS